MAKRLINLQDSDLDLIEQIASILDSCFSRFAPEWLPTHERSLQEVYRSLDGKRVSRVMIDHHQEVLGWIGAIPDDHVWEIHPIAVAPKFHQKGYGRLLVEDIGILAKKAGAVALWAGTSDETGSTSLAGADHYTNPLELMGNLIADPDHPIHFWRGIGFSLVGLRPDEEGLGKPGIHFARRLTL